MRRIGRLWIVRGVRLVVLRASMRARGELAESKQLSREKGVRGGLLQRCIVTRQWPVRSAGKEAGVLEAAHWLVYVCAAGAAGCGVAGVGAAAGAGVSSAFIVSSSVVACKQEGMDD